MNNNLYDQVIKGDSHLNSLGILEFSNTYTSQDISYDENGHDNCFAVESNSFWFNYRNEIINAVAKIFIDTDEILFDVGGGNGFVSKSLQNIGLNTVVVEPKINGARNAKKRGVKYVINGLFNSDNFHENTIANVGLFDVIEHIDNHNVFLNEINSLLKAKGKVLITVPAFDSLWSNHDIQAGHFRRYTLNSIEQVLSETDFDVLYASYFFSFLTIPNFLLRSIPYFLGKKISKKKKNSQHKLQNPLAEKFVAQMLDFEMSFINKSKIIPFPGNSIIVVAEKK